MSLQRHLRRRIDGQTVLEQLRDRHAGSEIVEVRSDVRYLQLHLDDGSGEKRQAWFDVDDWLLGMSTHLPGIPWREVPLSYLVLWLSHLQPRFFLQEKLWDAEYIALPAEKLPTRWLSVPAEPCPLMFLDWPAGENGRHNESVMTASRVPFRLRYVLGTSPLPLSQLVGLVPGDLLIIKQESAYLSIGHRRLFSFNYQKNQEIIVEERLIEDYLEDYEEEELHEWANLPVEIEFVLGGRTVTLAEIDKIAPGMVLPLDPEAEQKIKIYLNKKFFACGELVALENGPLAVEVNHVNTALIGETELSDV